MSSKQCVAIVLCATAIGCLARKDDTTTVAAEPNDLGITQVEIRHDLVNGDRLLTVRGLDDSDREIGLTTLRTGSVLYTPEPDLIPPAASAGTELALQVGQASFTSITPDRDPHETILPQEALTTFGRLHAVAAALQDEAGIVIAPPPEEGDVAFAATTCTASRFPSSAGSPLQCCQDGSTTYHKVNGGQFANLLSWRVYGNACRTSSGGTGCSLGGTGVCSYGPCTGQNQTVPSPNTTSAAVFVPTSNSAVCGADSNGSASGGGLQTPEPYTGNQSLYAGVTGSCPYQGCLYTGVPFKLAPSTNPHAFSVILRNSGGTGVVWSGDGDPVLGGPLSSGTYAAAFADGTGGCVSIQPGSSSQAVYSGACNGTTGLGQGVDCCFSNIKSNLTLTIVWEN